MVDTPAARADASDPGIKRDVQRFGRVVIVGGGCYGSWYAGQLARAAERGAFAAREVIVVDRDPKCQVVARHGEGAYNALPLRVVTASWDAFLDEWLAEGAERLSDDALVPSPLMPHLSLDWLMRRASQRWPARTLRVAPLETSPGMPWERAAPDGRHYVSFATWMCPVNCIEPARCPATRGPRDWSVPPALREYVARATPALRGPVIFHCTHRTYGVGMIDAAGFAEADVDIARWGADGPISVLVASVSHCHGALGVLEIR
ncbi:MAG TPA: hypothetical protein VE869_04585 [Gemmatimonas sp.]|nr:hypothetical protein [Gemmatimonas sp.]